MKTEGFYEIEGSIEELKNIFFTDSNINRRYDALTTIGYRLITQKQLYKYEEWYHNMEIKRGIFYYLMKEKVNHQSHCVILQHHTKGFGTNISIPTFIIKFQNISPMQLQY